ncbi:metallopeptidase family protein [Aestuariibius insulae]
MPEPTTDEIEEIARRTIAALPAPFADPAKAVAIISTDFIPDNLMDHPGDRAEKWDITGLYSGIPLTQKSSFDQPEAPDTVWLFRKPILAELEDRPEVTLNELVAHVTIHEFAHHFGWSDDDIAAIDEWWT